MKTHFEHYKIELIKYLQAQDNITDDQLQTIILKSISMSKGMVTDVKNKMTEQLNILDRQLKH